jgi:hypothetical protein
MRCEGRQGVAATTADLTRFGGSCAAAAISMHHEELSWARDA